MKLRIARVSGMLFFLVLAFTPRFTPPLQAQSATSPPAQQATPPAAEQPIAWAARGLAMNVAASLGAELKGKLMVDPNPVNLSSASAADFQQGCNAFSAELANEGITIASTNSPPASATVRLTLSENIRNFLWVADVAEGTMHKGFFAAVPPQPVGTLRRPASQLSLQEQFLVSLPEPILDAEILPAARGVPARLLVLQPERVALFTQANGSWQLQSEAAIQHDRPWPRNLRGRLQLRFGEIGNEAVLPGMACPITLDGTVGVSCKTADEHWIVSAGFSKYSTMLPQLSASTSLFTLAGTPEYQFESLTVFEPGWSTPPSGGVLPLLGTLPDGRAILLEGSATPVASFSGWGSDIAPLWSSSRARFPILVTRDGDRTQPDAIQAFDIVDRQAIPLSAALNFDGPITALWSAGEDEALVVSRNLKSGLYEAYLLHATDTK
ncbi:MAG TPA: hypothetical protein VGT03_07775 [Candidatus Acidoferrales bacterium]|nr:hypothetical protein [Candidatus Acidoferrales bacterium]